MSDFKIRNSSVAIPPTVVDMDIHEEESEGQKTCESEDERDECCLVNEKFH